MTESTRSITLEKMSSSQLDNASNSFISGGLNLHKNNSVLNTKSDDLFATSNLPINNLFDDMDQDTREVTPLARTASVSPSLRSPSPESPSYHNDFHGQFYDFHETPYSSINGEFYRKLPLYAVENNAYREESLKIPLNNNTIGPQYSNYSDSHRLLPAFAANQGFNSFPISPPLSSHQKVTARRNIFPSQQRGDQQYPTFSQHLEVKNNLQQFHPLNSIPRQRRQHNRVYQQPIQQRSVRNSIYQTHYDSLAQCNSKISDFQSGQPIQENHGPFTLSSDNSNFSSPQQTILGTKQEQKKNVLFLIQQHQRQLAKNSGTPQSLRENLVFDYIEPHGSVAFSGLNHNAIGPCYPNSWSKQTQNIATPSNSSNEFFDKCNQNNQNMPLGVCGPGDTPMISNSYAIPFNFAKNSSRERTNKSATAYNSLAFQSNANTTSQKTSRSYIIHKKDDKSSVKSVNSKKKLSSSSASSSSSSSRAFSDHELLEHRIKGDFISANRTNQVMDINILQSHGQTSSECSLQSPRKIVQADKFGQQLLITNEESKQNLINANCAFNNYDGSNHNYKTSSSTSDKSILSRRLSGCGTLEINCGSNELNSQQFNGRRILAPTGQQIYENQREQANSSRRLSNCDLKSKSNRSAANITPEQNKADVFSIQQNIIDSQIKPDSQVSDSSNICQSNGFLFNSNEVLGNLSEDELDGQNAFQSFVNNAAIGRAAAYEFDNPQNFGKSISTRLKRNSYYNAESDFNSISSRQDYRDGYRANKNDISSSRSHSITGIIDGEEIDETKSFNNSSISGSRGQCNDNSQNETSPYSINRSSSSSTNVEDFKIAQSQLSKSNSIITQNPAPSSQQQKIPRPENVFFIFRRKVYNTVVESNPGKTNPEISKVISDMWKLVSPEDKKIYQELANKAKQEHTKRYPGYKYTPRRGKKSLKKKSITIAHSNLGIRPILVPRNSLFIPSLQQHNNTSNDTFLTNNILIGADNKCNYYQQDSYSPPFIHRSSNQTPLNLQSFPHHVHQQSYPDYNSQQLNHHHHQQNQIGYNEDYQRARLQVPRLIHYNNHRNSGGGLVDEQFVNHYQNRQERQNYPQRQQDYEHPHSQQSQLSSSSTTSSSPNHALGGRGIVLTPGYPFSTGSVLYGGSSSHVPPQPPPVPLSRYPESNAYSRPAAHRSINRIQQLQYISSIDQTGRHHVIDNSNSCSPPRCTHDEDYPMRTSSRIQAQFGNDLAQGNSSRS